MILLYDDYIIKKKPFFFTSKYSKNKYFEDLDISSRETKLIGMTQKIESFKIEMTKNYK